MTARFHTVIIGSGPAGLIAGIMAARRGGRVTILEAMSRPGLKLLASGGGRCNVTNTLAPDEIMERFGRSGRFMTPALRALPPRGLREFLRDLGVETHAPDGFHVFPVSHDARAVLDALLTEVKRLGVTLALGTRVMDVHLDGGQWSLAIHGRPPLAADTLILATGGLGYPALGGNHSGFKFAAAHGHRLTDTCPAMVPLVTRETWPGTCVAYTLPKVTVRVNLPKCGKIKETGDLIFTRTGLAGPVVQDVSGEISHLLTRFRDVPLFLQLFPGRDDTFWGENMRAREGDRGGQTVREWLLSAGVNPPLADMFCSHAGDLSDRLISQLPRRHQDQLARVLAMTPVTVTGTAGWAKAMVTRGGVSLKDVDPSSMASRRVPNLHFAGEMLDLDGPCGGFNLQWAFASGFLAGISCYLGKDTW